MSKWQWSKKTAVLHNSCLNSSRHVCPHCPLILSNRKKPCKPSSSLRLSTVPTNTSVSAAKRNVTPARWFRSQMMIMYSCTTFQFLMQCFFCLQGLRFLHFPYLLTLQLKRFDFDYTTMHRIKLNDRMTFPEELDMSPFIDVEDEVRRSLMLSLLSVVHN